MDTHTLKHDCSMIRRPRRQVTSNAARLTAPFLAVGLAAILFASPTFAAQATQVDALANQMSEPDTLLDQLKAKGFCSRTAVAELIACGHQTLDDFWLAKGRCINIIDEKDRKACNQDAQDERNSATKACQDVHQARLDTCKVVGEDRYDPDFDPAQFVDPTKIGKSVKPNKFFPLIGGTRWTYKGGGQIDVVTITNKTKLIDGVTCVVSEDVVSENGKVVEQTDDWFAQDLAGNVWYCGELARDFETFPGDKPQAEELTSIDGSFKAGRDGDLPGIIALASPQVGDAYREESSLNNAEDIAQVVSTTGTMSVPAAKCNKTCLVTSNPSPLEPGVNDKKFYAPGVGLIFENDNGKKIELVSVTH